MPKTKYAIVVCLTCKVEIVAAYLARRRITG
jgi:hypothetical protein